MELTEHSRAAERSLSQLPSVQLRQHFAWVRISPTCLAILVHGAVAGISISLTMLAEAAPIYRCDVEGKVLYTQIEQHCKGARARTFDTSVALKPTHEVVERARVENEQREIARELRLRREIETQNAYVEELARQQRRNAAVQPQPTIDPSMNEKVMVHTPSGWDYKTRAQLIAEEQARAARSAARASSASAIAPPTFVDQYGKTWINHGATAFNPSTGKTCVQAGGVLVNCN